MEPGIRPPRELPDWITQARHRIAGLRQDAQRADVSESTKTEYERVASRYFDLKTGATLSRVELSGTASDYVTKAACAYFLKTRVIQAMNFADKVWKDKKLTEGERWNQWKKCVDKIEEKSAELANWQGAEWWSSHLLARDGIGRKQNHKKSTATDQQLEKFWKSVKDDAKYSLHFLIMEFTGCRPEEFADGVQMWVDKNSVGELGIKCKIVKRAKQRASGSGGKRHGLTDSVFFIPVPNRDTPRPVKERYRRVLDALRQSQTASLELKVESTDASTVGRLITKSFCKVSEKAGLTISPCSLRHRFAANAKASAKERHPNDPQRVAVEVADMLGQASTATQLRYGRTNRRGGSVAMVRVDRVRVPSVEIRNVRGSCTAKQQSPLIKRC